MRILWLSHFLPYPPRGGNLQRSYNLLRVAAATHEVHLITLVQRAVHPSEAAAAEAARSLAAMVTSISTHRIPSDRSQLRWCSTVAGAFFSHRSYAESWFWQRTMASAISEAHGRARFDLVHVDTIGLWPYTRFIPGTPIILNHHNVESQLLERRAQRERLLPARLYLAREARKVRRLEARVCPAAAANLVVSALDADRLHEAAPHARTFLVENGVDTAYFRPDRGECEGPELLFVASMGWYPNAEAALVLLRTIWPALRAAIPSVRLTIVGPHPPRELSAAAARDDRLTVTGFVDDVRPYFNRATAYVCPIQDGGGTRLKILDAMAMAIPIVATGLAVEGLDLADGVHYLRADSPTAFVEQVSRLLQDSSLRRLVSGSARRLVERRFSWPVVGERLLAAFQEAARASAGRQPRLDGSTGSTPEHLARSQR